MLRKDCVSSQGLEQNSEAGSSESSIQHAPEPSAAQAGGESTVESSPPSSSSASQGETSPGATSRDPHVCRDFPCPQCHPTRDSQQEENYRVVEQHSLRAAASSQSAIFRSDPEQQDMELAESEDNLQREVATAQQGQKHIDHYSKS